MSCETSHFRLDDEVLGLRCVPDQSVIFMTLGPRAQQQADEIGQAVPAMRIKRRHPDVAQCVDNRRGDVWESRSNYNAGLNPGGLLLQNDLAHTEYGLPVYPPV